MYNVQTVGSFMRYAISTHVPMDNVSYCTRLTVPVLERLAEEGEKRGVMHVYLVHFVEDVID